MKFDNVKHDNANCPKCNSTMKWYNTGTIRNNEFGEYICNECGKSFDSNLKEIKHLDIG